MSAVEVIASEIFADGLRSYAVLDGASIPELRQLLYDHRPEHECLYLGELAQDIQQVAPYLVELEPDAPFTSLLLERGWGKHWGIFAQSAEGIRALRQHFRRFLTVYDPQGKAMLFRYYDPRVLRTYLPTCNADELGQLFGPVTGFLAEGESLRELLRFESQAGKLVKRVKDLEKK
ncbi:MAG: DUF4123 domain-containing protein [Acidobacteria bacterium]|nr:DUF4123 domain-containing protein [Acidobacteriota bacterium]